MGLINNQCDTNTRKQKEKVDWMGSTKLNVPTIIQQKSQGVFDNITYYKYNVLISLAKLIARFTFTQQIKIEKHIRMRIIKEHYIANDAHSLPYLHPS